MIDPETAVSDPLVMWVIYDKPADFPHYFVLRPCRIEADQILFSQNFFLARSLEEVRTFIPLGLFRLPRQDGDEPQIVETWF